MSLSSRMIIVLTTVGLISGGFLAGVAKLTKERIALNIQAEIEEAIKEVVDDAEVSTVLYEEEGLVIYRELEEDGDLAGFAIQAIGVGFQDKITLMFGLDETLTKITGLTIIEQKETPGLGAKITDWNAFLQFWEDRDATGPLSLRKPSVRTPEELMATEINSITAATISSRKVLEIVNLSLDKVRELIAKGKITDEEHDGN
ncbi:MAG TPA: FMN-binding protein [Candidatus Heimdallarchaeota archaeon]|nr:FMN-binding protein [Candidatus Heimdallarchaeota archaeon]